MSIIAFEKPMPDKLTDKETEILVSGEKLDVVDTELQNLKLEIARLELKKLELIGVRKQALHILNRQKIEHEALKREYFRELRTHS